MTAKSVLLQRKHISDCEYFDKADSDAFQLSIDYLRFLNCRVSKGNIEKLVPGFDKAFWTPGKLEIAVPLEGKLILGYAVVHQSIHSLVASKYGSELPGRPRLTLLSEALAGGVELYYSLLNFKNGGDPEENCPLRGYKSTSESLKKGFIKQFNSSVEDPFEAYKVNVISSVKISTLLLETLQNAAKGKNWKLNELETKIKRVEHLSFLGHKVFTTFVLFVGVYCGFKSSKKDLTDSRDCMKILKRSRSLAEFMERMGADILCKKR